MSKLCVSLKLRNDSFLQKCAIYLNAYDIEIYVCWHICEACIYCMMKVLYLNSSNCHLIWNDCVDRSLIFIITIRWMAWAQSTIPDVLKSILWEIVNGKQMGRIKHCFIWHPQRKIASNQVCSWPHPRGGGSRMLSIFLPSHLPSCSSEHERNDRFLNDDAVPA